ncbi:MAG: hypothetical protein RBR09_07595 [Desulfobulbaceae bacterium]|jgi:membrane associated rhomboid family serine protease|nr:hypothetical protein [Desulfobulbaceae bacterium]MDY0351101.1 hypothetical protein [Desulfobulbaceae bacterium]
MQNWRNNQSRSVWFLVCFIVWLIINVRVEAGIGTSFERAVDGLVGGAVLLAAVFLTLRYVRCVGGECPKEGDCDGDKAG